MACKTTRDRKIMRQWMEKTCQLELPDIPKTLSNVE